MIVPYFVPTNSASFSLILLFPCNIRIKITYEMKIFLRFPLLCNKLPQRCLPETTSIFISKPLWSGLGQPLPYAVAIEVLAKIPWRCGLLFHPHAVVGKMPFLVVQRWKSLCLLSSTRPAYPQVSRTLELWPWGPMRSSPVSLGASWFLQTQQESLTQNHLL